MSFGSNYALEENKPAFADITGYHLEKLGLFYIWLYAPHATKN